LTKAEQSILYLNRGHIEQVCRDIDTVEAMREVFRMHSLKQTILPEKTSLMWVNDQGETVSSFNMPGYLGGTLRVAGTKVVNENVCNHGRGLPRASGLALLYDDTTVYVNCIMEGAYLSSLRTASVTVLAADLLQGAPIHCVALIGAGALARAHIPLLVKNLPHLQRILIFDFNRERVAQLQSELAELLQKHQVVLQETETAEQAIRPAQLIVPVTTTTMGYIRFEWLTPGAILVNVSLDDPLPEVVLKATTVIVDDWNLVRSDQRRLLGRMYREGRLLGPDERSEMLAAACRRVDMQLGDLVMGTRVGRRTEDDIILVNPSGLSLEDLVLAARVYQKARELNIGVWLER
jgi:ornithine cyclodeaminase/alanine dehydrogenase-like protein (mu-crystallin family)